MKALRFIEVAGLKRALEIQSLVRKDNDLSRVADNDGFYIDLEHERVVIQKPTYHDFYISYNELEDELVDNFKPLLNSDLNRLKEQRSVLVLILEGFSQSEDLLSNTLDEVLRIDLLTKYAYDVQKEHSNG